MSALGGDNLPNVKRFTDTAKWDDPWFLGVSLDTKLAFWYITEKCDVAGVWDPNKRMANFCFGRDIDWDVVEREMGERLKILPSGKWQLVKFIPFQYGKLSPDCVPHRNVFALIERHGIAYPSPTLALPYKKGSPTQQDKTIQEKDKTKTGQDSPEAVIYAAYPRKEGRADALRAIKRVLATKPKEVILEATQAFAAAVAKWPPADHQFIPHPATWFNRGSYDDDRTEWERKPNGAHKKPNDRSYSTVDDYSKLPGMP